MNDAVVGIGQRLGKDGQEAFFVYDVNVILNILVDRDGMTPDDAVEYFQENIQGSNLGEATPAFIQPMDYEKIQENIEQVLDTLAFEQS